MEALPCGGKLILEKHAVVSVDERSGKEKVSGEYHGYQAEPKDWFLSITKISEKFEKPKWLDIAKEAGLPDYFIHDGKCNKSDYSKALEEYLMENDVEFDTPDLSRTQALGLRAMSPRAFRAYICYPLLPTTPMK